MSMEHWQSADFDEIMSNPEKFGAPTFEQFKANRDKWLGRWDDKFAEVDRGSRMPGLGRMIKKYKYQVEHYTCDSLEECEKVALSLGIDLQSNEYKYETVLVPQGGGTCDAVIKFISTDERKRRESW